MLKLRSEFRADLQAVTMALRTNNGNILATARAWMSRAKAPCKKMHGPTPGEDLTPIALSL